MEEKQKEFEDKIKQTSEVEKELQNAEDAKGLESVLTGSQEVYIEGKGKITFEYPGVELVLEGDDIAAKFKAHHLRKGDLLTEAQLKAILNRAVTIEQDGKEITVGTGAWTEQDERDIENLPTQIQQKLEWFEIHRKDVQKYEDYLLKLTKTKKDKAKRTDYEERQKKSLMAAQQEYFQMFDLRKKLLTLQAKRVELFADSLEERALFEKIKLYAPSCIKIERDGKLDFLWKSDKDMMDDSFVATRILGLFSLFVRGADISFFDDAQDVQT